MVLSGVDQKTDTFAVTNKTFENTPKSLRFFFFYEKVLIQEIRNIVYVTLLCRHEKRNKKVKQIKQNTFNVNYKPISDVIWFKHVNG